MNAKRNTTKSTERRYFMENSISSKFPMIGLSFLLIIFFCVNSQAQGPFKYWPSYNKTPISNITAATWNTSDNTVDGWDWSLPGGITPATNSKLINARSFALSLSNVNALPPVNFACNPVISHWINWKDLEPTNDSYKWTEFKNILDVAKSKGYKSKIRIMSCRTERSAPTWLKGLGISEINYGSSDVDYDPADPIYNQHYLDLVADFGASGIPSRDDVVGLYVGYTSSSWGDEGIGPDVAVGIDPAIEYTHVKQRIDAWANITNGMRYKMVMGGESAYGIGLGFGLRRGFVEHYMYHTPDAFIGQQLDANKYMDVNESNTIIANNLYNGDENEEYAENKTEYGPTTGFPYRYFSSNIRALQMRCNEILYNDFSLMPEMMAWVGLELGRTQADAPDVWTFLRETYIKNGVNANVKNFERWLYQRDSPGYETVAVLPINKNYNSWLYSTSYPNDYIARKGAKIGFAVNDVVFPTGQVHNVAIKISYYDNVAGTLKLVYNDGSSTQERTITANGTDAIKTATFFVSAKFNATGFNYDFELQSTQQVPVSIVRVIKTGVSNVSGITKYVGEKLKTFPAPAHDKLNVTLPNGAKILSYTITDISGKKQSKNSCEEFEGNLSIDVLALKSGYYILQLDSDNSSTRSVSFIKR